MSRKRRLFKNNLLINVHRYIFYLYDEMKALVMRMPEDSDQIKVWSDIVGQISLFFNRATSFSTCVAKAICADPSFRKCHWTAKDMNTLLY